MHDMEYWQRVLDMMLRCPEIYLTDWGFTGIKIEDNRVRLLKSAQRDSPAVAQCTILWGFFWPFCELFYYHFSS